MRYLLISIVIFVFGLFNFFAPVRGIVHFIFNPIQYGLEKSSENIVTGVEFYLNLKEIYKQNLTLLAEKEQLLSEIQRLSNLSEENKILKEQLNVKLIQEEGGLILATTLGNFSDPTGTSVFLDKGANHGVTVGDVVVKGQHLVGTIKSVTSQRSILELITSPNTLISVMDQETKTEGLAKGEFGTSVIMERILPGETVNIGDNVVTTGRDGKVLPGFLVGQIVSVSDETAKVLKVASINTLVDVNNLGKVFIILQK